MKHIKNINRKENKMKATTIFLSIFSIFIIMIGCSQDGMSPQYENSNPELAIENSVSKRPSRNTDLISDNKTVGSYDTGISVPGGKYPQMTTCSSGYFKNWGQYKGSNCRLENGSFFEFYNGALTPPADIPFGETVTITMRADKDPVTGELVYTFGPSGCHFDEPAILWLDYSDLGTDAATLYYLDNDGNRIEHLPDNIDFYNKRMCIYIDHFSRYAVAYSD